MNIVFGQAPVWWAGIPVAAFGVLSALAGGLLTWFLNRNSKLRETAWERRIEAYGVLVSSLEDCLLKSRVCAILETGGVVSDAEGIKRISEWEASLTAHHVHFASRRFIVSRAFALRHNSMVGGLQAVSNHHPMFPAYVDYFVNVIGDLTKIAERELRL